MRLSLPSRPAPFAASSPVADGPQLPLKRLKRWPHRCSRDYVAVARRKRLQFLKHRREHSQQCCRASEAAKSFEASATESRESGWASTTKFLASAATAVFLILLLPQIIVNAGNMTKKNFAALSAIAWVGYLTALLGNVMLLSYFLERKESSGALVQIAGIVTNAVVLTQMRIARSLPASIFYGTASLLAISALVSFGQTQGRLDSSGRGGILRAYSDFLGVLGVSSLSQASAHTFLGWHTPAPGLAGLFIALSLLILDRAGRLNGPWKSLWRGIPAWSATLLFAFQPIAQLVKNFSQPKSLAGLSKSTLLLAMTGNGLMVPRALYTRDVVWLTGSAWASFTGWFQLFSLYVNRSPEGVRYLGASQMLGATLLYLAYNTLILWQDIEAKDLPIRLQSVRHIMLQKSSS